jgi:hypothetical protein
VDVDASRLALLFILLETSSSRIEISVREAEGGEIGFKNGNGLACQKD